MAGFIDMCKYCKFMRVRPHSHTEEMLTMCCYDPRTIIKGRNDWCGKFKMGGSNCEFRVVEVTVKGERVFTLEQQKAFAEKGKYNDFIRSKLIPKDYLSYDVWYEK